MASGNTVLEEGDVLRIIGEISAIRRFRLRYVFSNALPLSERQRSYIVYGDGKRAEAIEHILTQAGADTVAWGQSGPVRGRRYNRNFSITEALEDMAVELKDGFVAASNDDAENFMTATVARERGQKNCAICIREEGLLKIADLVHAGGIFSPDLLLTQEIKKKLLGLGDLSLHLFPGSLEIYETTLREGAPAVDQMIEDLDLNSSFLIGGILRNEQSIAAKGRTRLREGDRLLLFLLPESARDMRLFLPQKSSGNFLTELFSI